MYPERDFPLATAIPRPATYWTPAPEDIDEEGFGFFRDVWDMRGVSASEASDVLAEDRRAFKLVARLAENVTEFEALAVSLEEREFELGLLSSVQIRAMEHEIGDELHLGGLDLGMAGIVHAMSAAGFFPAASCRSHDSETTWSRLPVVLFAADRRRVLRLQPLVIAAGCGLAIDDERGGDYLSLEARSIPEMQLLAGLVLDDMKGFQGRED
jgi:hypothetical protein